MEQAQVPATFLLGCHLTPVGLEAEKMWPCQGFIGPMAASSVDSNFASFYAQTSAAQPQPTVFMVSK